MGSYVRRVKIKSLFEKDNNLIIDFTENTNCIYGDNGTGKTTVINLVVAALKCDMKKLIEIPFSSLEIMTARRGTKRQIRAIKIDKSSDDKIEFNILPSNLYETFESIDDVKENSKKYTVILEALQVLLNLTYVPLSRLNYNESISDASDSYILNRTLRARNFSQEEILDIVDAGRRMLGSIEKEFVDRYSFIQKRIGIDSAKMKNNIVQKILIDKNFVRKADQFVTKMHSSKGNVLGTYDPKEILDKFKEANIEVSASNLEEHFRLCDEVTREFEIARNKYNDQDKATWRDYSKQYYRKFSLLVMLECLSSIITDIETIEKKKQDYLEMYNNTEKVINEFFMPRKRFAFNTRGGFSVDCNGSNIDISNLSSGEKHLIALLGRVALQSLDASVFLADEPELSLHLDWQRSLITSMNKLSPNMQIIVATHSPAIIPSDSNQIDLEECRV